MSLKIDRVQLEIVIQNDKSRQRLRELEDEARGINKELKKLKPNSKEWLAEMDKLKKVQLEMDEIVDSIGLAGLSLKELTTRQKELNAIMRQMDPRTAEYKQLEKQLKQVNARHTELRTGAKQSASAMDKMTAGFNKFRTVALPIVAVITSLVFGIGKFVKGNAELGESLADVIKTTGLTRKEVGELYDSFQTFNTKTANKELLEMAKIAGKLGVTGKKNIEGFVNAADKINVALGEDLGGNSEETLRQLGKIVDVFKVKQEFGLEKGLLKVGSAINSLGQASTANEEYMVDFTKRVGGIAPNANVSAADVLGLAATLDQLGQTAEVSSTVYGKLMIAIGNDTPYYAKLAGMSIGDFNKLLAEDTNEAFIKVLEGAKSTQGGVQGMADSLKKMGVDGQRSASVLGVLTNNIDLLREQQALSNKEFDAGTSIITEFNTKNNTLGASLSKIGKHLAHFFVNSAITKGLSSIVGKMAEWIEIPLSDTIQKEKRELNLLVKTITNANTSNEARKRLMADLQQNYPDFLGNLDAEKVTNEQLRDRLKEVNEEYNKKILLAIKEDKIKELREKQVDLQIKEEEILKSLTSAEEGLAKARGKRNKTDSQALSYGKTSSTSSDAVNTLIGQLARLKSELSDVQNEFNNTETEISDVEKAITNLGDKLGSNGKNGNSIIPPGGSGGNGNGNIGNGNQPSLEEELKLIRLTTEDEEGKLELEKWMSDFNITAQDDFHTTLETMLDDYYDYVQSKVEYDKWYEQYSKELSIERLENMSDTYSAMGDVLSTFGEKNKAVVLAKIAADTAASISSLMAVAEANPLNTLTFGGAGLAQWIAGLARIAGNVAQAKKYLKGFYYGGSTGTGSSNEVAGPVHRNEYVIPSFVLSDPSVGQFVSTVIEPKRVSRIKNMDSTLPTRGFAYGGSTNTSATQYDYQNNQQSDTNSKKIDTTNQLLFRLVDLFQSGKISANVDEAGVKKVRDAIKIQENIENSVS